MSPGTQSVDIVRRFCEKVSDGGTFTLDLLRQVDQTVDSLAAVCEGFDAESKVAHGFITRLSECELLRPADPDGIIVEKIDLAQNSLSRVRERLAAGRQSALDDDDLSDDHREAIVSGYESAIASAESLIEAMGELKGLVVKLDRDLTETIGPFNTVDELFEALEA